MDIPSGSSSTGRKKVKLFELTLSFPNPAELVSPTNSPEPDEIPIVSEETEIELVEEEKNLDCKSPKIPICINISNSGSSDEYDSDEIEEDEEEPEVKEFKCDLCEKYFATKSLLNAHRRHSHHEERNFLCESCGRR
jgi:uncharacterized Zn-finger protein